MANEVATKSSNESAFELAQRQALALTKSELVPQIYRGTQGMANALIALNLAHRMQADPLMVMQNLHVVQGRPGFSSAFLVASVNANGRFSPMRYEFRGKEGSPEWACRAWAIEESTKERLDGTWITMAMADAEGWTKKQGSKWKTMPEQMLRYRAAAFWVRAYAPEISMGMLSTEELADIAPARASAPEAAATEIEAMIVSNVSSEAPSTEPEPEAPVETDDSPI